MTNNEIQNAYVGDTQVAKIYLGTDIVWPTIPPEPVYSAMPLTFEINGGGRIYWGLSNPTGDTHEENAKTISYSKDGGATWTDITSYPKATIQVSSGDTIMFKGNNSTYFETPEWNCFGGSTARFKVYGNIMSLINGDNFTGLTTLQEGQRFDSLFSGCTYLTSAENLILPATGLSTSCYFRMFEGCTRLTTAPELPAVVIKNFSYFYMFNGCTKLNYIKCLARDKVGDYCTMGWVADVSATGTFVKRPNATWSTGVNGIPAGWTVEDAEI